MGEKTKIRNELEQRNQQIYDNYGYNTDELAQKYFLSKKVYNVLSLK